MAVPMVSIRTGSQLEKSYRSSVRDSGYRDADALIVINGTVVILRRHSVHGTICSQCGNDDVDHCQVTNVDKLGFITEVQCLICGKYLSAVCRKADKYLENIGDPSVLEVGDHIGWYRPFAYWHHAIVTRQYADRTAMIGYSFDDRSRPLAKVMETEMKHRSMTSSIRGTLYRISYDDCYTNEYTALRAERTIGEEKYDFFEQNCEHSTTWCKTGNRDSHQVESGVTSLGKITVGILLRAAVLSVLWLLQFCHFTQGRVTATDQLWIERGVNISYMTLVVAVFVVHSVYKGCTRIKSSVPPSENEVHHDVMEVFRKDCTVAFFKCCCRRHPGCSRIACTVCCLGWFCCSVCQATCSFCAWKLRGCSVPCCGRPVCDVTGLIIRSVVREVIAASGAFLVVWFMDDVVSFFEGRGVTAFADPAVNRGFIVIVAIMVVSLVAYPVGVVLARWADCLTRCCCCCGGCRQVSNKAHRKHAECVKQSCPVHDEVVMIPAHDGDFHITNISIRH